jgi:gas vesicle protein
MSDDRGHSDLALTFAFLAGALLGAGVALLLAPKSGEETRAQLADFAHRAQEKAREAAGKIRGGARSDT